MQDAQSMKEVRPSVNRKLMISVGVLLIILGILVATCCNIQKEPEVTGSPDVITLDT